MSECLRTGAIVAINEYGCVFRGDLHRLNAQACIFSYNPESISYDPAISPTHSLWVDTAYQRADIGIIVFDPVNLTELESA